MSRSAPNTPQAGAAFAELEQLVRHLGEELSAFRRRALQAEARMKALEAELSDRQAAEERAAAKAVAAAGADALASHPRVTALETENADLRRRLEAATTRTRQVLDRVRFLRQQQAHGGER